MLSLAFRRNRLPGPQQRDVPIRELGEEAIRFGEGGSPRFAGRGRQSTDSDARFPTQHCSSCEHSASGNGAKCVLPGFRIRYGAWLRDLMVSEWLSLRADRSCVMRLMAHPGMMSAMGHLRKSVTTECDIHHVWASGYVNGRRLR